MDKHHITNDIDDTIDKILGITEDYSNYSSNIKKGKKRNVSTVSFLLLLLLILISVMSGVMVDNTYFRY